MNTLYPIFLKQSSLKILIVGGGKICYEKLFFIYKNSPQTKINIVSKNYCRNTMKLIRQKEDLITFKRRSFQEDDLIGINIVISTTDDRIFNSQIVDLCKNKNILINVADKPELCDFYLGSIVTKGDLKIAISTNGKSPTFAKRLAKLTLFINFLPASRPPLIPNDNIDP